MTHIVEKDWITEAGLRACVLFVNDSHRCGYVAVPSGHRLHGVSCNNLYERGIDIDVHGGITFSESGDKYPVENDGLYWFGFDCAHSGDATKYFRQPNDVMRSLDYCVGECESLARQLAIVVVPPTAEETIADLQQQLTEANRRGDTLIASLLDLRDDYKHDSDQHKRIQWIIETATSNRGV
jgi:hypothetical protein